MLEGAATIRQHFDNSLSKEIDAVCAAIDALILVSLSANEKVKPLDDEKRLQELSAQLVIRKTINDIYGGIELLRLGYLELTLSSMRIAFEGFALATIICDDATIWNQYLKDEFSTNKSVDKMLNRYKNKIPESARKALFDGHKNLHKYAHTTVSSVRSQLPISESPGSYPIGGHFEDEKLDRYRGVLADFVTLTKNIEGFLRVRYGLGGAELMRPA